MNEQQAIDIALAHSNRYDFDERIIVECQRLDPDTLRQQLNPLNSLPGDTGSVSECFDVVVKLSCSDEKIQSLIGPNDGKVEIETKKHFLGKGSKLKLTICSSGVVREKWLGVQLS